MKRVTLRPASPEDEGFLLRVYASTRLEELAPLGWSDADRDAFLREQGMAQHHHYRTYYRDVAYNLICIDGQPAGRLYIACWPSEMRLMDIALLPAHRNAGVGTTLMDELIKEAAGRKVPLSLHVESFNPARRLYERLGFRLAEEKGPHLFLSLPAEVVAVQKVGAHVC